MNLDRHTAVDGDIVNAAKSIAALSRISVDAPDEHHRFETVTELSA